MNNEPVAWMETYEGEPNNLYWNWYDCKDKGEWKAIPLYTHLAKTLTDEEITQIVSEKLETWNTKESMIDFARAILRKAQEK